MRFRPIHRLPCLVVINSVFVRHCFYSFSADWCKESNPAVKISFQMYNCRLDPNSNFDKKNWLKIDNELAPNSPTADSCDERWWEEGRVRAMSGSTRRVDDAQLSIAGVSTRTPSLAAALCHHLAGDATCIASALSPGGTAPERK